MASRLNHPVFIHSKDDRSLEPTLGSLIQVEWNREERLKNAIRTTLTWLGIMCGSALIPFWHYFLVPTLFITAWVLGLDKWNESLFCEGGSGICPKCRKPVTLGKSAWKPRLSETCESCFQNLELRVQPQDSN